MGMRRPSAGSGNFTNSDSLAFVSWSVSQQPFFGQTFSTVPVTRTYLPLYVPESASNCSTGTVWESLSFIGSPNDAMCIVGFPGAGAAAGVELFDCCWQPQRSTHDKRDAQIRTM